MSNIDFKQAYQSLSDKSIAKKTFLKTNTESHSYGDLSTKIQQFTSILQQSNLKKGDKVLLSTKNNYAVCYTFFGLTLNGITAIMLDPDVKTERAQYIFNLTKPNFYLVDSHLVDDWNLTATPHLKIEEEKPKKKGKLFGKLLGRKNNTEDKNDSFPASLANETLSQPSLNFELNDIAYVLFTSGTTSHPKAVPITYKMFTSHVDSMNKVYEINEQSSLLNFLNLYHTDGLFQGPILAFCNHLTLNRPMDFAVPNIGEILDYIYKEQISHIVAVPTMLALIDKYSEGYEDSFQNGNMKCIMCSTAPLPAILWENFEKKFHVKIVNVYGLTETVSGGLFSGLTKQNRKIGTVGKPTDCEIRIVDLNNQDVVKGDSGELLIKGDNVMPGYLNNSEENNNAFLDGWFRSGDLAKEDEDGFVYITGRKKNIIIRGGFNVQPEEVNEVLVGHPKVMEAATVGLPHDIWGEEVVTAIIKSPDQQTDEKELTEYCRTKLEPHCVPSKLVFLSELPKGISGKVKMEDLKQLLSNSKVSHATNNGVDISDEILAIAADTFKLDKQTLKLSDSSLTVEGWDSLAHLNLIVNLEEHFNVKLSTQEVMNLQTLSDAQNIILDKK
ncbi:MAG: AMP-binding protein [Chitinophagales bacterium]